jgi:hypothetical protein
LAKYYLILEAISFRRSTKNVSWSSIGKERVEDGAGYRIMRDGRRGANELVSRASGEVPSAKYNFNNDFCLRVGPIHRAVFSSSDG